MSSGLWKAPHCPSVVNTAAEIDVTVPPPRVVGGAKDGREQNTFLCCESKFHIQHVIRRLLHQRSKNQQNVIVFLLISSIIIRSKVRPPTQENVHEH